MGRKTTRKCSICRNEFDTKKTEYIKDKTFMELDCYINKQLKKGIDIETINKKIEILKESMRIEEELKKQKEIERESKKLLAKQNEIDRNKNKEDFLQYIREEYDISNFSKMFYIKVAEINNGTYKGMNEGISYEDLLFMFKRKQQYLNKINERNKSIGKSIKGISRVNYDLAVIIGMYDEYKEWKRKKSILQSNEEVKKEESNNTIKIDYNAINSIKSNDEDDILDILNDIY